MGWLCPTVKLDSHPWGQRNESIPLTQGIRQQLTYKHCAHDACNLVYPHAGEARQALSVIVGEIFETPEREPAIVVPLKRD